MVPDELIETMHVYIRALADPARLRLAGLLAEGPKTANELCAGLGQAPPAVLRDVEMMKSFGLVREEPGPERRLAFDFGAMQRLLRSIKEAGRGEGTPAGEGQGLLRRFFEGPHLKTFPSKLKDKHLVLEEILRRIPATETMQETELNRHLKEIYADFATLRRELVDAGYMSREAGVYQVTEKGREARRAQ
jgi:hypothetical protein